jgi:hypothetical protein
MNFNTFDDYNDLFLKTYFVEYISLFLTMMMPQSSFYAFFWIYLLIDLFVIIFPNFCLLQLY